jgi:hypothetical protein
MSFLTLSLYEPLGSRKSLIVESESLWNGDRNNQIRLHADGFISWCKDKKKQLKKEIGKEKNEEVRTSTILKKSCSVGFSCTPQKFENEEKMAIKDERQG